MARDTSRLGLRGKQLLLGNTVHEIVAHWFDMAGRFIGLERFRAAVDPDG